MRLFPGRRRGGGPYAFAMLAVDVRGDRVLVCRFPPGWAARHASERAGGGGGGAETLHAMLQFGTYASSELRPFAVEALTLDPPAASVDDVWRRTNCGVGAPASRGDLTPMLELAGRPAGTFVRADAHYAVRFVSS